jgi:glycosyltransferase involved in cell wall biosynthesis
MPPKPVTFNGKFLGAAPTGVHRVAREMLIAFDQLLGDAPQISDVLQCNLVCPPGTPIDLHLRSIPASNSGRFTWQFWEQFELPRLARGRTLVSLCNLAPLSVQGGYTLVHDAQVYLTPQSYSTAFRSWYRFALPRISQRAAKVLTVSEYSREMLAHYRVAPADRITVIPNGVDHILRNIPDRRILEKIGVSPGTYAVALANTQKHKNVEVLFRAFSRSALASLQLVLVGAHTAADFQREGLPPPSNVVFAGRVDDAELRALYESAVCIAFPSTTEGFGLPPLEAMLVGCPAVVAPCGALPEVCGDAAIYASPHDPAAWEVAISDLVGQSAARTAINEAGRSRAGIFTWARSAQILADILLNDAEN